MPNNTFRSATMHGTVLLYFLFVLFAPPALALAAPRPDAIDFEPLSWNLRMPQHFTLDNGLQAYFHSDTELPLVDITMMVSVGRSIEPVTKAGLMELFALTLETSGPGGMTPEEFDAKLDELASEMDVDCGPYTTTLHLSVLKEDLPQGLSLLADIIKNPGFDSKRYEISYQQLQERVRRRADIPGAIAEQLMLDSLYPDHPLGKKPTLKSLSNIDIADVKEVYQQYFGAGNLYVAISGDVSGEDVEELIRDNFSSWKKDASIAGVVGLSEKAKTKFGPVLLVQRPLSQTTVRLVERGITKDNPDMYAVQVMNYILGGGGFNSRLMREIRSNRGLAYSVFSHFSIGRRLQGAFIAGCETQSATVKDVLKLFNSIIGDMCSTGVTAEELSLAKKSLVNSFVFRFENTHGLVIQAMRNDFFEYPPDYLQKYCQRINAVTAADVKRVANKYLHPEAQTIILVGDLDAKDLTTWAGRREIKLVDVNSML